MKPPWMTHRHGRRGPPWKHGHRGPPFGWRSIHSIHRRVQGAVFAASLLGGFAGYAIHHALIDGTWRAWLAAVAVLVLLWPLAWVATFRIARPVRDLARIAAELRSGQLDRRDQLPADAGEVGEVADALGGLVDRVTQQLADQRALLGAVSHELRSPLARLRIQVELLRDGVGSASLHDEVQHEIDGMDHLVADLLAAARIDFEAVRPVEVNADDVARRALEAAELPHDLLVDEGPYRVVADPTLLGRALSVLLDNARRYGGDVHRLGLSRRDGLVVFTVDDDGPGFAEGEPEMAFQPFWRRPGEAAKGTGLGLALVRQIARAHDGQAGAGNRPEGGARVWLALPEA